MSRNRLLCICTRGALRSRQFHTLRALQDDFRGFPRTSQSSTRTPAARQSFPQSRPQYETPSQSTRSQYEPPVPSRFNRSQNNRSPPQRQSGPPSRQSDPSSPAARENAPYPLPKQEQRPIRMSELSPKLLKAINANPTHPVNHAIKAETVDFVDEEGNMERDVDLKRLISQTDPRVNMVRQVDENDGTPIVKIVQVKDIINEHENRSKKPQRQKAEGKQLEINWAIDANDIGHRCKRLQDFLSQGRKVEVMLAPKRKGRRASLDEMEWVLKTLRDAVAEVPGARETKPLEGTIGGQCVLVFDNAKAVSKVDAADELEDAGSDDGPEVLDKYERKRLEKEEKKRKYEERARAAAELHQAKLKRAKAEGITIGQL